MVRAYACSKEALVYGRSNGEKRYFEDGVQRSQARLKCISRQQPFEALPAIRWYYGTTGDAVFTSEGKPFILCCACTQGQRQLWLFRGGGTAFVFWRYAWRSGSVGGAYGIPAYGSSQYFMVAAA
ncbi:hypothetical protein NPIL_120891 [Nephila pilipes]|uniref:Uncharacterized protein n=1 Tax=Nephila pilipes TaxID=299642 RepID=A0A8X6MNQ8_NEPPI|nr:hypothetical protein NPIL_120891 [Nephila pilipes]